MFARTGYALALPGRVVVFATVTVLPEANVDEVPHVNEIEASGLPVAVK